VLSEHDVNTLKQHLEVGNWVSWNGGYGIVTALDDKCVYVSENAIAWHNITYAKR
tara:strand:- start:59 stop:223 length:165 start_codon:yes stop_codon:yes gene_type:complete